MANVARLLGYDLLPWQRAAVDVLYEVDPATGLLWYEMGTMLVPRRAGKTIVGLSALVHRANAFDTPQRSISTMQTGIASREMFRNTWVPTLERSALAGEFTPMFQIAHEELKWRSGSVHVVAAPSGKAGVGGDFDLWLCDEAWAHADNRLEGAILPTQATRTEPQTLVLSMAGTEVPTPDRPRSAYLIGKRDTGRALVDAADDGRVFYLEFSAPEGADLMDPATWWGCHPALGHTITEQRLRTYATGMDQVDFAKEFLGVWPNESVDQVIPAADWAACRDVAAVPADPLVFAVDVSPDRRWASVAAAGTNRAGYLVVEVVRSGEGDGTAWVEGFVAAALAKAPGSTLVLDKGGPAGSLIGGLAALGVAEHVDHRKPQPAGTVRLFSLPEMVRAAGQFYDLATASSRPLRHRGQPPLDIAVGAARKRPLGEAWAWGRRTVEGEDITPLVACSLALWGLTTRVEAKRYAWRIA